jgi:hypothetical protein
MKLPPTHIRSSVRLYERLCGSSEGDSISHVHMIESKTKPEIEGQLDRLNMCFGCLRLFNHANHRASK